MTSKPKVIHPDEKESKFRKRLIALVACPQSIFALARAIGAHPRGSLCFLLPPFAASRNCEVILKKWDGW
jgi:hypothetical protein